MKTKQKSENDSELVVFCTKCGNELLSDALFCEKCGTKVPVPIVNNVDEHESLEQKTTKNPTIKRIQLFCLFVWGYF